MDTMNIYLIYQIASITTSNYLGLTSFEKILEPFQFHIHQIRPVHPTPQPSNT